MKKTAPIHELVSNFREVLAGQIGRFPFTPFCRFSIMRECGGGLCLEDLTASSQRQREKFSPWQWVSLRQRSRSACIRHRPDFRSVVGALISCPKSALCSLAAPACTSSGSIDHTRSSSQTYEVFPKTRFTPFRIPRSALRVRFHSHRTPRRHRDHRDPGGDTFACLEQGQRQSPIHFLPEQLETASTRLANLRYRPRRLDSAQPNRQTGQRLRGGQGILGGGQCVAGCQPVERHGGRDFLLLEFAASLSLSV